MPPVFKEADRWFQSFSGILQAAILAAVLGLAGLVLQNTKAVSEIVAVREERKEQLDDALGGIKEQLRSVGSKVDTQLQVQAASSERLSRVETMTANDRDKLRDIERAVGEVRRVVDEMVISRERESRSGKP